MRYVRSLQEVCQVNVQWKGHVSHISPRELLNVSIRVKVKLGVTLSLCLTKYHAMKTYPALN
jgi:hypothetical protein